MGADAIAKRRDTVAKKRRNSVRGLRTGQLAKNLIKLRADAGFTQIDVAQICECTSQYVSDLECGRLPSLRMLGLLAFALNVSPAVLLDGVPANEIMFLKE